MANNLDAYASDSSSFGCVSNEHNPSFIQPFLKDKSCDKLVRKMANNLDAYASDSSSFGCVSNEHNPSFIQPFLKDKSCDKLRIPAAFTHNFNGNIPRKISLKSTTGTVWQAELQIVDDHIYITNGWEQYVKDRSLANGELLVFHYLQNATFLVMVFGTDGEIKAETVFKKAGAAQPGPTTTTIDFKFQMTFNNKNSVTIPQCIIKNCESKLPVSITLRNDKGRGLKTQLQKVHDRVVMGYFNVLEFVELSNAKLGDKILFKVTCRDGNKIKGITMKNLSQSKKL